MRLRTGLPERKEEREMGGGGGGVMKWLYLQDTRRPESEVRLLRSRLASLVTRHGGPACGLKCLFCGPFRLEYFAGWHSGKNKTGWLWQQYNNKGKILFLR